MKYIIFVIVAVLVIVGAFYYRPSTKLAGTVAPTNNTINSTSTPDTIMAQNPGLKIEDIKVGTGDEAKSGDLVTVNYIGTFIDGKKFDASIDHGTEGFTFPLGQGNVIKGWDIGVVGMKIGGTRTLTVSPELAYGSRDVKDQAGKVVIPANSTLIFQVELLKVRTH